MRTIPVAFALGAALVTCNLGTVTVAHAKAKVVHEPRTRIIVRPLVRPAPYWEFSPTTPYWDSYIVPRYRYRPEDDRVDPYGPPVVPVIRYGDGGWL